MALYLTRKSSPRLSLPNSESGRSPFPSATSRMPRPLALPRAQFTACESSGSCQNSCCTNGECCARVASKACAHVINVCQSTVQCLNPSRPRRAEACISQSRKLKLAPPTELLFSQQQTPGGLHSRCGCLIGTGVGQPCYCWSFF